MIPTAVRIELARMARVTNCARSVATISPLLAAETVASFDEAVAPHSSFRVEIDGSGHLVWVSESDGIETRWTLQPDASGWQRSVADVIKLVPIRSQL